jgi:hypothetical protein
MRIRAVIEFDMKFDDDLVSIEELMQNCKKWGFVKTSAEAANLLGYYLKYKIA